MRLSVSPFRIDLPSASRYRKPRPIRTRGSALSGARIVELEWSPSLEQDARALLAINPELLLSVFLRRAGASDAGGGEDPGFWQALEAATRLDGVAMIHYHAGPLKSYRLTPRVDAFLKARLQRARVQLVSAGGDTDTQASAATVYESVLLGANGGALTHL